MTSKFQHLSWDIDLTQDSSDIYNMDVAEALLSIFELAISYSAGHIFTWCLGIYVVKHHRLTLKSNLTDYPYDGFRILNKSGGIFKWSWCFFYGGHFKIRIVTPVLIWPCLLVLILSSIEKNKYASFHAFSQVLNNSLIIPTWLQSTSQKYEIWQELIFSPAPRLFHN